LLDISWGILIGRDAAVRPDPHPIRSGAKFRARSPTMRMRADPPDDAKWTARSLRDTLKAIYMPWKKDS